MATQRDDQGRKRPVWFSPLLLAVALFPAFAQTSIYCEPLPPGDTTLSELAVIVGGVEQIAFDANQRSYDVWLPMSADTALVRAIPTDPNAQVSVSLRTGSDRLDAMPWTVGGGEVDIPLVPGTHTLLVKVFPPPNAFGSGISGQYTVEIQVGCSQCDDGNECTDDTCEPVEEMCVHTPVGDGVACDFGGVSGLCVTGDCQPTRTRGISVACARNVTGNVDILPFELMVTTTPIEAHREFTAALTGTAVFSESFLDEAQAVVPGGVRTAQVFDVAATVAVRSGATGPDVELNADFSVLNSQCSLTGVPCTGAPGQGDCMVIPSVTNVCTGGFTDVPVIDGIPNTAGGCTQSPLGTPVPDCDCAVCESLDPAGCRPGDPDVPCTKGDQCSLNGFCVNGGLNIALLPGTGNYTAGPSGSDILFGWYDGLGENPAPGLLSLPPAVFADPPAPVGMRVGAGGLFVAFQCLMAVDSGGPNGVTTCQGGANNGLPCENPADNSNNACVGSDDAGLPCAQESATACTAGSVGECVNNDCGPGALCSPADLAATTADSLLETFLVP